MIYFIQNTTTKAIKIGYSKNPKNRLEKLQAGTPDELVLLGTVHGGLEHETAFHGQFAKFSLSREWFKGDIYADVMKILAEDAAAPKQQKMNVIVAGDCDKFIGVLFDPQKRERRDRLGAAITHALDEIHRKTPVEWVITGGERVLDWFAGEWAKKHNAQHYQYFLNWKRYGRGAASRTGQQMLRSRFDPKMLLVFYEGEPSVFTKRLLRGAEKAGIPVVLGFQPQQVS